MVTKKRNSYDIDKNIINILRGIQFTSTPTTHANILYEEKGDDTDNDNEKTNAIAITDDPKFGQNVLSSQIEQFQSSVDSGAEFSKPDKEHPAKNPLIYMPETGNLIFSGIIPRLNNLKFQFLLKTDTGNGCFVWVDGLILNTENFKTLSKLYGFYLNWVDAWATESKDFKTIAENEK